MKKVKKQKEPSLFRKIINIHFEQIKRRRAIKLLQKQSWSFDFLSILLVKASKIANRNLTLEIVNKDGVKIMLTYDNAKNSSSVNMLDDSIFDKLDDNLAIEEFIAKHSVR